MLFSTLIHLFVQKPLGVGFVGVFQYDSTNKNTSIVVVEHCATIFPRLTSIPSFLKLRNGFANHRPRPSFLINSFPIYWGGIL